MCRVEGEFPEGELICEEPILVVSFKIGLCRVDPKGKECRTVFQRLSFNGKTSVVRCLPLTGRTHQIRVHLQYLGFPILRDPIYGSLAWGPNRGKGGLVGKRDEELLQALVEEHCSQESLHLLDLPEDGIGIVKEAEKRKTTEKKDCSDGLSGPNMSGESHQSCGNDRKLLPGCSLSSDVVNEENQSGADSNSNTSLPVSLNPLQNESTGDQATQKDHLCSECKLVRPDPTEKDLIMYLHALRYKGPDFEYSTPLPGWANEDWVEADFSGPADH